VILYEMLSGLCRLMTLCKTSVALQLYAHLRARARSIPNWLDVEAVLLKQLAKQPPSALPAGLN